MRSLPALLTALLFSLLVGCKEPLPQTNKPQLDPSGTPYAHTANILSYGPRPTGSKGAQQVRTYVSSILTQAGWSVGTQTAQSQTPIGTKTFTNLIARFPASEESDPWKSQVRGILCAHLDSKLYQNKRFLGADDAASACGLILNLAQEMAANPAQASQLELVFFDGEEGFTQDMGPKPGGIFDGLYGSRVYAARWRNTKNKPSFGILLDMIGHENLSIKVPSDSPPQLVAVMNQAAQKTGHSHRFRMSSAPTWDDHVPLNNEGIPTIDIIGDFLASSWWHTPKDNLSIISPESLDITKKVVTEMLQELLKDSP